MVTHRSSEPLSGVRSPHSLMILPNYLMNTENKCQYFFILKEIINDNGLYLLLVVLHYRNPLQSDLIQFHLQNQSLGNEEKGEQKISNLTYDLATYQKSFKFFLEEYGFLYNSEALEPRF